MCWGHKHKLGLSQANWMYQPPKCEEKTEFKNDTKVFSFNHWMGMLDILKGEGLEERWVEVA